MTGELEKYLQDYCLEKWPDRSTGRPELQEFLAYEAPKVWEGDPDQHRWIIYLTKVVKVGDKYISFGWATSTGDNSLEDSGFEWNWDTVCEVVPKKVETISYVPIEQ